MPRSPPSSSSPATDLRSLWNETFDATLTLQREAFAGAREAARASLAFQRANVEGLRATFDRLASVPTPMVAATRAAAGRAGGESRSRGGAEEAVAPAARQMVNLAFDPYDRMISMWESQVESATSMAATTVASVTEANRAVARAVVDTWAGLADATERAARDAFTTDRASSRSG